MTISLEEAGAVTKPNKRQPTRVSAACDRCRRQKQRCDDFRPCTNCVHARVSCSGTQLKAGAESDHPRKRLRTSFQNHSESTEVPHEDLTAIQRPETDNADIRFSVDLQSPGTYQTVGLQHMSFSPLGQRRSQRHPESSHSAEQERWPGETLTAAQDIPPSMANLQAESAIDMTRRLFRHGSPSSPFSSRATFAIPGGESEYQGFTRGARTSVRDLVGVDLPDRILCDSLLDTYFLTVHWFSLVVFEPKFRKRYNSIMDAGSIHQSDHAFIILLLMVLVMGCWYDASPELASQQNSFLRVVRANFMDIIDEDSLEFVQLSALLGSFYLYHGRPRSSFSILGAATKTSQAIGLHREPDSRMDRNDAEERKRIWWTIYTWDRFATITYGRPLGINDNDCNVSMPSEIYENISSDQSNSAEPICLSTYQEQLNLIYRIASPVLENIYGIRISTDLGLLSRLPEMIANVDRSLQQWKQALPVHLSYDLIGDIADNTSTKDKLHALQALSLQLTYDNIMIVLHRTLLADQRKTHANGLESNQLSTARIRSSPFQETESNLGERNFERCLAAALSISQTQRKPNLIALAQNSHLVSFLAMNLFTSSVVMSICALSDTMSDVAQEAKRGMSRTLHLLKKLSSRASLPMQYSTILEDLVGLILKREKSVMLFGLEEGLNTSLQPEDYNIPATTGDNVLDQEHLATNNTRAQTAYRSRVGSYAHPQAQTIFDLQRVFEENTVAKDHQGLPVSFSYDNENGTGNASYNKDNTYGVGYPSSVNPLQSDDLGQFWLWNMEPFQEDLLQPR